LQSIRNLSTPTNLTPFSTNSFFAIGNTVCVGRAILTFSSGNFIFSILQKFKSRSSPNTHQETYKKRCLIESFFGTTKRMFGSYLEERTEKMAFHVVFLGLLSGNIGNILVILFITLRCKRIFLIASNDIDIIPLMI